MKSSEYARQQIKSATDAGNAWNRANAMGQHGATRNDIVCAIWGLASAVFFVGEQIALSREARPEGERGK